MKNIRRTGGLLLCLFFFSARAWTSPQGGSVIAGSASISQSGAGTYINQISKQVIIDWNSFGIGPNELVQFLQPSSVAVALNRVTGVSPSLIYGILRANGRIFLINPNGILFGAGSQVDVGGLVASTLEISNSDFLAGNYSFSQLPSSSGESVVNDGSIGISGGGFAALISPTVENGGTIDAPSGSVYLDGGTAAVLSLDDSGLVNVVVTGSPERLDMKGNEISRSPLPARGAGSDLSSRAVNRSGMESASSAAVTGTGDVVLSGSAGMVENFGVIEANGNGGSVTLDSMQETVLSPGSSIQADGVGAGSTGGTVSIDSSGRTLFESGAVIEAEGGSGGSGGTVEISDEGGGSVAGTIDLSAASGTDGTLLIDPTNTFIDSCGASTCVNSSSGMPTPIDTYVATSTLTGATGNVTIKSSNAIGVDSGLGTVTVPGTNNLTLEIVPSSSGASVFGILFEGSGSSISTLSTTGNGKITLCAAVTSCDGNVAAASGTGNITLGNVITVDGVVTISANGDITGNGVTVGSFGTTGANGSGSGTAGKSGGAATTVSMSASGSISLVDSELGSVGGNGGNGSNNTGTGAGGKGGNGGKSGAVTLTAGTTLTLSGSTVQSSGGNGGAGATGGSNATGKGGNGGAGGKGGASGAVTVTSAGIMSISGSFIQSSGGNGANGGNAGNSTHAGSNGGNGGSGGAGGKDSSISVTVTSFGGLTIASDSSITNGNGVGGTGGTGGTAGSGGTNGTNGANGAAGDNTAATFTISDADGNLGFDSTSSATSDVSSITISTPSAGNISLGTIFTGTSATVTVTSAGNIEGGSITAGTAKLTAGTDIGGTAPLTSALSTLSATAGNGAIDISDNGPGSLTLDAISASGTGNNVTLSNSVGNLTIDAAMSGGAVNLASAEAITDTSGYTITAASSLVLSAATGIGTTSAALITKTPELQAWNTNSGNIAISNTGNLSIDDFSLGTGTGVENDGSGSIAITNAGAVDLPGNFSANSSGESTALYAPGGGNITLNATGAGSNIIACDGPSCTGMISANSYGGSVDFTAGGSIDLGVKNYADITTTFGTSSVGAITLNAAGSVTLDQGTHLESNTGNTTVTAGTSISVVDGAEVESEGTGTLSLAADGGTLTVDGASGIYSFGTGGISLYATGNIVMNGPAAIFGLSGSITADSTGGSITTTSDSPVLDAPTSLTIESATGIGSSTTSFFPQSPSLILSATGSGAGIYVREASNLTSLTVTTNNGPVSVLETTASETASFTGSTTDLLSVQNFPYLTGFSFDNTGGNIVFNSSNLVDLAGSSTSVSLTASGYIANGTSTGAITANSLTMTAATGIGYNGTTPSSISTNASSLSATTTTLNTAQINVADSTSLATLSVTTDNSAVGITASNVTGSVTLAGGSGGTDYLNAQFTGSTLANLTVDNTGGNLVLTSANLVNMGTNAATNGTLEASGYIANGASSGSVAAKTLTLAAATGIGYNGTTPSSISTSASNLTVSTTTLNTAQINVADSTSLATLSVTTDNSSVGITASNVTGSVSLAGGSGGTDYLNAQFTGSTLTNLTVDNTGGNLVLTSANLVNMGTNAATNGTLEASGYIANGASSGSVVAKTLTLVAATGIGYNGTTPSSISTNAANLTVKTTAANTAQINISDSTSLAYLSVTTTNSSVGITASNATGSVSLAGGSGGTDYLNAQFTGSTLATFVFDNTSGNLVFTSANLINLGTNAASSGTLVASGYIANGASSGSVTAGALVLTAGSYAGASSSPLSTAVSTLTATASGGGIYVSNSGPGALTLDAISASGSGNNVSISNSAGSLAISGSISGGAVALSDTNAASGSITDASGSLMSGTSSVTLSAVTGIGTVTQPVMVDAPSLTVTTTGANTAAIYLSNSNTAVTSLAFTVNNSSVSYSESNDPLSFVGGSGGSDLLNIVAGTSSSISSFSFDNAGGNIVLGSSDNVNLGNAPAASAALAASGYIANGSSTGVVTANAVTLTSGSYVGTSGSPISVETSYLGGSTSGGSFNVSNSVSGGLTLNAITASGSGNDINISNSSGNLTVGASLSGNNVTLNETDATTGNILMSGNYTITGSTSVTLNAINGIGTTSNSVNVSTPSLSASTVTTGTSPIYLADSASLISLSLTTDDSAISMTGSNISGTLTFGGVGSDLLNAVFTGSALTSFSYTNISGNILIDDSDVVNLGTNASSTATLSAGGYIANGSTNGSITANTLILTSGSYIGQPGSSIATSVSSLTASSNDVIYISNSGAGALTLNSINTYDGATYYDVNISNTSDIDIAAPILGNNVTLTSSGAINDASGSAVSGLASVTLAAANGVGASGLAVQVTTPSLTVSTTTSGTGAIYVADSSALTTLLSVTTANSSVSVTSTGGTLAFSGSSDLLSGTYTNAADELPSFSFDNTSGNIEFNATNVVNLAGTGSVSLAASGAISDSDGSSNSTSTPAIVTGGTLNLNAASVGVVGTGIWKNPPPASWTALYTNIKTLNTTVTNNLVLDNSGGLTEGTITVGGTAYIIANGSVISGGIIAGGGIYLIATGNIVDGSGGADVDYQGQSVDLVAGGTIGTASDPVSVVLTGSGGVDAFAAGGSIYIGGASPLSGSSQGVFVSLGGTVNFSSLAQAAIATFQDEGLPQGVSLIQASPYYSQEFAASQLLTELLSTDPNDYFGALSQDNPYISNTPDWSSSILFDPLDEIMLPVDPVLFEDWVQTKRRE